MCKVFFYLPFAAFFLGLTFCTSWVCDLSAYTKPRECLTVYVITNYCPPSFMDNKTVRSVTPLALYGTQAQRPEIGF